MNSIPEAGTELATLTNNVEDPGVMSSTLVTPTGYVLPDSEDSLSGRLPPADTTMYTSIPHW
jgi:hypothetical protein